MIEIKNSSGVVLCSVDAPNLRGADLGRADLVSAYLRGAYLGAANLRDANLRDADLRAAYLGAANLSGANLVGANLRDAILVGANLRGAVLVDANLGDANLRDANLVDANLSDADLRGATLPHFQICPERGSFVAWKRTSTGVIRVRIPKDAKRTSSLVGRKCRAEYVIVLGGPGCGGVSAYDDTTTYEKGATIRPDQYNPDIRIECTHGIHFFMTHAEAEEYIH